MCVVYLGGVGRWDEAGSELFRLSDQGNNQFCLGPVSTYIHTYMYIHRYTHTHIHAHTWCFTQTHEEPFTELVQQEITSYRQLPLKLYQVRPVVKKNSVTTHNMWCTHCMLISWCDNLLTATFVCALSYLRLRGSSVMRSDQDMVYSEQESSLWKVLRWPFLIHILVTAV